MRVVLIALLMSAGFTATADDFEILRDTAERYLAAMKAALALSDDSECSETIAKAEEYAAAKVAYHRAARQVMRAAIQGPTGQNNGKELISIFRGFGPDKDEEAMMELEARLARCPASDERDHAQKAVERSASHTRAIRRGLRRYRTRLQGLSSYFYYRANRGGRGGI
jgi:hypothetical protein